MEARSKPCWAWDAIDFQDEELGEHDVRAAEACAQLTCVPTPVPTTTPDADARTSSGKVDIGALMRTARAPAEREQRAWPAPQVTPSRERIARTSTPEHARHARRRSFVRGTLIGGSVMAAVALGPAMVSIARAPHVVSSTDHAAIEPVSVVVVERTKTPRAVRDGAPPTLRQLVLTQAAAPVPAQPIAGADVDQTAALQPSAPRTNTDERDRLATAPPQRAPGVARASVATSDDDDTSREAIEPTRVAAHDSANAIAHVDPANAIADADPATSAADSATSAIAVEAVTPAVNGALHASTAAPPAPASEPTSAGDSPSLPPSLDRLIEDAVGLPRVPSPAAEASPAPAASAPARLTTPTRDEVDRSLASARARVEECAAEGHGLANVRITVAGSTGRVMSAVVEGALAGTPAGSCVARAVRGATFPPFAQPTFTVQYPFQL